MPEENIGTMQNLPETWDEFFEEYNRALKTIPALPSPELFNRKLEAMLAEDESITLDWEEMENLEAEYEEEFIHLKWLWWLVINAMNETAVKMVRRDTGFSEEKAEKLWNFIYKQYIFQGISSYQTFADLFHLFYTENAAKIPKILKEDEN